MKEKGVGQVDGVVNGLQLHLVSFTLVNLIRFFYF